MSENNIPKHLGIILDGNRRWAKQNGLPSVEGHKQGYEALKKVAEAAFKRGIEYISAYVFSTENWKRSEDEVSYLMNLLQWLSKHEIHELEKRNIRVLFVGQEDRLSPKVIQAMRSVEEKTQHNDGGKLLLCLNYGGKQEIAHAVNQFLEQNPHKRTLSIDDISEHLFIAEAPPIDLIIRTSGEQRLSNFMLWRAAYSELVFFDKHWPSFTPEDLETALTSYANRHRRFGGDYHQ